MSIIFWIFLALSVSVYFYFFAYPHFLKPVEFDLIKESREILMMSIRSSMDRLSFQHWEKIKNHENPLVFIYLFQLCEPQVRNSLKKHLDLSFDPMASKKMLNPSNQTLKYIRDYLIHS